MRVAREIFYQPRTWARSSRHPAPASSHDVFPANSHDLWYHPARCVMSHRFLLTETHPPANIEWAKHLWEEWKYRHDSWHRTLYRFLLGIGVIMAVPLIPGIQRQALGLIRANSWIRWTYSLCPAILFGLSCWFSANQWKYFKSVERKLACARGNYQPDGLDGWEVFRKGVWGKTTVFIVGGICIWLLWFCYMYPKSSVNFAVDPHFFPW